MVRGTYVVISKEQRKKKEEKNLQNGPYDIRRVVWARIHYRGPLPLLLPSRRLSQPRYATRCSSSSPVAGVLLLGDAWGAARGRGRGHGGCSRGRPFYLSYTSRAP
jgi:hypothetical protein